MDSRKLMAKNSRKHKDSSKKTIRIMYSDPYATDSSSEDDDLSNLKGYKSVPSRKVFVSEIVIDEKQKDSYHNGCRTGDANCFNASKKTKNFSASIYEGVRRRKWGTYAAEIHNPVSKEREWIGTFETPEDASAAYQNRKREFNKMMGLESKGKSDHVDLELSNERSNENSCLIEKSNHLQYEYQSFDRYGDFRDSLVAAAANETLPYEDATRFYHHSLSSNVHDMPTSVDALGGFEEPLFLEDNSVWKF